MKQPSSASTCLLCDRTLLETYDECWWNAAHFQSLCDGRTHRLVLVTVSCRPHKWRFVLREAHKRIDWTGTLSRKSGAEPEAASAVDTQKRPLCLSHSSRHLNCPWHRYRPPNPIFLRQRHLRASFHFFFCLSEPQPSCLFPALAHTPVRNVVRLEEVLYSRWDPSIHPSCCIRVRLEPCLYSLIATQEFPAGRG